MSAHHFVIYNAHYHVMNDILYRLVCIHIVFGIDFLVLQKIILDNENSPKNNSNGTYNLPLDNPTIHRIEGIKYYSTIHNNHDTKYMFCGRHRMITL